MINITLGIIILTAVISFTAFSNQKIVNDLIFDPPAISQRNQWYRFITCGFIHADIPHLAFNMLSLYFFGGFVEEEFRIFFGKMGSLLYIAMYLLALVACLLPTYAKHKDNYYYRSLGASGAVSAVVFAGILLSPLARLYLMFIPIGIPGFIFGPVYLIVSAYLANKGHDHINHSAHIWGSLFGVAFVIITCNLLSDQRPLQDFIFQVTDYISRLFR